MSLFGIDHWHHWAKETDYSDDNDPPPWAVALSRKLDLVIKHQEVIMIDTSKLLAAVADEKTESASLRALLAANTAALKDVSAQLAALQASGGATAAQLAQVQADVDSASAALSTDNQAAADAITANTVAPATPATPAGQ